MKHTQFKTWVTLQKAKIAKIDAILMNKTAKNPYHLALDILTQPYKGVPLPPALKWYSNLSLTPYGSYGMILPSFKILKFDIFISQSIFPCVFLTNQFFLPLNKCTIPWNQLTIQWNQPWKDLKFTRRNEEFKVHGKRQNFFSSLWFCFLLLDQTIQNENKQSNLLFSKHKYSHLLVKTTQDRRQRPIKLFPFSVCTWVLNVRRKW